MPENVEFHQNNRSTFEKYDGRNRENFLYPALPEKPFAVRISDDAAAKAIRFWLFEKGNPDHIIGTMSIQRISWAVFSPILCVIGYKMDAAYRDMGYMTEALHFLISFIFTELKSPLIEALMSILTIMPRYIFEKLEFIEEGIAHGAAWIQGVWQDHLRFALISRPES